MKSAFGIKLEPLDARSQSVHGVLPTGESVTFWHEPKTGWCGSLNCGNHIISDRFGASSMQVCYRSLRGQVGNLHSALARVLNRGAK